MNTEFSISRCGGGDTQSQATHEPLNSLNIHGEIYANKQNDGMVSKCGGSNNTLPEITVDDIPTTVESEIKPQDSYPRVELLKSELDDVSLTKREREAAYALIDAAAGGDDSYRIDDLQKVVIEYSKHPEAFQRAAEVVNAVFKKHDIVGQMEVDNSGNFRLGALTIDANGVPHVERTHNSDKNRIGEFIPERADIEEKLKTAELTPKQREMAEDLARVVTETWGMDRADELSKLVKKYGSNQKDFAVAAVTLNKVIHELGGFFRGIHVDEKGGLKHGGTEIDSTGFITSYDFSR